MRNLLPFLPTQCAPAKGVPAYSEALKYISHLGYFHHDLSQLIKILTSSCNVSRNSCSAEQGSILSDEIKKEIKNTAQERQIQPETFSPSPPMQISQKANKSCVNSPTRPYPFAPTENGQSIPKR